MFLIFYYFCMILWDWNCMTIVVYYVHSACNREKLYSDN